MSADSVWKVLAFAAALFFTLAVGFGYAGALVTDNRYWLASAVSAVAAMLTGLFASFAADEAAR